jgi:hypothetical protein
MYLTPSLTHISPQVASSIPENPDVTRMLITSFLLGSCETALSLIFAYGVETTPLMSKSYPIGQCSKQTQVRSLFKYSVSPSFYIVYTNVYCPLLYCLLY